jgi:putative transposase
LVDGKGVPLSVSVDSANRHDVKMSKARLQGTIIYRPEPTIRSKQHMCLDKGYDFPKVYELMGVWIYNPYPIKRKEKTTQQSDTRIQS